MSVITQMVAPVEDRWPSDRKPTGDVLEQVLFASHLLGGNRALANYGGGNTSAKGTATDHVGREIRAMWVKGSGSDLATMAASDFTPLRLDEILPLFERDAMSDEQMVAHLARCQLDPAAPRSSIETLMHAFVPADHVHHTHPDAINVLACARDGAELIAECFGEQAAWIEYIRPGFTLAKLVGEAVRADSAAPSRRARQARPDHLGRQRAGGVRAHRMGVQPGRRARQPQDARASLGSEARARALAVSTPTRGRPRCASCCRRCAARCRANARRS